MSEYRRLGDLIMPVYVKNSSLQSSDLRGVNYQKSFMPSVANTVGVDISTYKLVSKNQFACNLMHVGRDECLPIALHNDDKPIIVSPAYFTFKIKTEAEMLPEFLFLWFKRKEFDRQACFYTDADVRQGLIKSAFLDIQVPVPPIEERRIVAEYQVIERRIENNRRLIATLESTAKTIYRHMFVDNIDPNNLPQGWRMGTIGEFCSKIGSGATPNGGKTAYTNLGISLIRSMNVFDSRFDYSNLAKIDKAQATKLNNVAVEEGDVLLNITGVSVARCCIVPKSVLPARVNQHVMILRPNETLGSDYLMHLLISTENKVVLLGISEGGSTREALTKSDVESFPILIPDKNEITKFHSYINPITVWHDKLQEEIEKYIELQLLLLTKLSNHA